MEKTGKDLDRLAVAAAQKPKEKEYWLKKLSADSPKSFFPYDHKKEGQQEETRDSTRFNWEGELVSRLKKLTGHSDVRLHMVMAAGVAVLLAKYSNNNDIVIATPVFHSEKENNPGEVETDLLNTIIPLRITMNSAMVFKDLLLQVKETVIEAVENQAYPIDILVKQLKPDDAGANDFPLFDVVVLLENIQHNQWVHHTHPNIIFSFRSTEINIDGRLEYNALRYEEDTPRRIIRHLSQLLEKMLDNMDIPLAKIDVLNPQERKQLLFEFNDTCTDFPRDRTIVGLWEEQVEKAPDHTALIGQIPISKSRIPDKETPPGHILNAYGLLHLSYRELNRKSNQLAHFFKSRGFPPGSTAALLIERSPDQVLGILAILKAGGAYLPIDPTYPQERILGILEDSRVSFILTDSKILGNHSYTALQHLRANGTAPHFTGLREQSDFDSLPHPDRSLINYEKYSGYIGHAMVKKAISIQGTRGCPYDCAYCHRTMLKKNVARSAENIFAEVKYYYDRGVRRFSFVDEIFNLNTRNSQRFFQLILKNRLKVQLFFPNGMRADRLTRDYIDLMVEAGTVNLGLALETASPRLQKLIKKNMDIEKLREMAQYFCSQYPGVILELFTMHGFPTETEEEAMATLNFIKSLKWVHFPYVFLLKIHPSTDMMKLALDNGVSRETIERSMTAAFHEIPETLPFPKRFTRQYVAQFMNDYFLCKERLLHVLPYQLIVASEDELARKYDNYLPAKIRTFTDILDNAAITREELGELKSVRSDSDFIPDYAAISPSSPVVKPADNTFNILLLDLSVLFSREKKDILHGEITEPLGLMYLLTYLNKTFGNRINGRMYKSQIDFDSYEELKPLVCDFQPHLIGIGTLSYFKDFFHRTAASIKEWGIAAPIIAGGPYGTSDYRLVLQDPAVELTVLREGELTLAELVDKMMANNNNLPDENVLKNIPGIAFIRQQDKKILKAQKREILCIDKILPRAFRFPIENPGILTGPDDLLYLISTSGSTGKPKSIMMVHRSLVNLLNFQWRRTTIDFDKVLQFASIAFDVSFQEIFSTLLAGGILHLITDDIRANISLLLDFIGKHRLKTLFLPPAFLKFIFDQEEYAREFPVCVRHIVTAGEQLLVTDSMRRHLEKNRVCLHNHYGPAETHVVTTFTMTPPADIPYWPSIGTPIDNTNIFIIDTHGNLQPIGAAGELLIGSIQAARGYLNNPELTAEKFHHDLRDYPDYQDKKVPVSHDAEPHPETMKLNKSFCGVQGRFFQKKPLAAGGKNHMQSCSRAAMPVPHHPMTPIPHFPIYKTGDMARWLRDGKIEFLGRVDDQVQIRGFRVEPGEIEAQLLGINYINKAVVIVRQGDTAEPYLCAYVVLDKAEREFSPPELRDILSENLPDYMVPSFFIRLKELPLNRSGKINRRALPAPGSGESAAGYTPPGNALEKKLAEIWSQVLGIDKESISIHEDFFELGGHSLKATVMNSRLYKEFNVKLTLGEIFRNPSIRKLAAIIPGSAGSGKTVIQEIPRAKKSDYYPLSHHQQRLYILHHLDPASPAYNLAGYLEMHHETDQGLVEKILTRIIRRHESLRTIFTIVDGHPFQVIVEEFPVPFEVIDLSMLEAAERTQARQRVYSGLAAEPFDLTRPLLFRSALVKLEPEYYQLMFNMHHIISDGWSLEILRQEFTKLYEAYQQGREPELPPLDVQYKDFAQWHNRQIQGPEGKISRQFWKQKLANGVPALQLPADWEKGKEPVGAGYRRYLSRDTTRELKKLAGDHHITLFTLMFSVFLLFLSRICNQKDIVCSVIAAGRDHPSLENIIGFFVNSMIIQTRVDEHQPFARFLQEVNREVIETFQHQSYPLEQVFDQLEMRYPEIPVSFNMTNIRDTTLAGAIESFAPVQGEEVQDVKFHLEVYVTEYTNGIEMNWVYKKNMFELATIDYMIGQYIDQLEFFRKNAHQSFKDYLAKEKKQNSLSFKRPEGASTHAGVEI